MNLNLKKLKKVNFRKPKYIFPPVIILPLLGVIYYLMAMFDGKGKTEAGGVVTDSINMTLPDARGAQMEGKMAAMNKRFSEGGALRTPPVSVSARLRKNCLRASRRTCDASTATVAMADAPSRTTSTTMPVSWSAYRTRAWIGSVSIWPSRNAVTRLRKPRRGNASRR